MLWFYPFKASWTIEGSSLPLDWPLKGTLEFQEYGLQYRKGLELALKGITLNIHEREKVSDFIPKFRSIQGLLQAFICVYKEIRKHKH